MRVNNNNNKNNNINNKNNKNKKRNKKNMIKRKKKKRQNAGEGCMLESRLAAWSPAAPSVTGASNFRCIIRNREVVENKKEIQILPYALVVFRVF